jgi:hypothetical protein
MSFSVHIPSSAYLTFSAAKGNQGCHENGSVQVWIELSAADRRLLFNLNIEGKESSRWIENRVNLAEYANRDATIIFKTDGVTSCTDYYWADPVLIAPNDANQTQRTSEEQKKPPNAGLAISNGRVSPNPVRHGQSIEVSFFGPALTPETYFDILYREPGRSVDQTLLNYQQGTSSRHLVVPATQSGTWVITGVRAHSRESDHDGAFHPLWMPFNVTR